MNNTCEWLPSSQRRVLILPTVASIQTEVYKISSLLSYKKVCFSFELVMFNDDVAHLAVGVHTRQQRGLGAHQPRRLLAKRRRRALDDVALEDEPAR